MRDTRIRGRGRGTGPGTGPGHLVLRVAIGAVFVMIAGLSTSCGDGQDTSGDSPRRSVPADDSKASSEGAATTGGGGGTAAGTPLRERAGVQLLEPKDWAAYVDRYPDVPVVNVHTPYEGHIAGTDAFVAFDEIGQWEDLPEDLSAPIVLYCRSGRMSAEATAELMALGYTNIVDLRGGMEAWTRSGRDLLDDPSAAR